MSNFERGSEWRKWDLHVHSPHSFLGNNFRNDVDAYIEKIKNKDLAIIGLTNYFKFDEKDFVLKQKLEEEGIIVFLNLELRLSYQNKEDACCDYHIIFSDNVQKEEIALFLENLTLKINGGEKKANSLTKLDFDNAIVEFKELKDTLNQESLNLKDVHLTGFLSRGSGNARTSTAYGNIVKNSNFLIHSTDKVKNIEEDRKFWLGQGKPLLQSSDAHGLEDIGQKFTWIKADLTFEGLKQIICEPDERVYIGEKPPILSKIENNKTNYLRSLEINQVDPNQGGDTWFKNISMPFNKELVAIIGKKGSGKSGIADMLGLLGDTYIDKGHFSFLHKDKFLKKKLANKFKAKIVWESGGESDDICLNELPGTENPESVRFIPQNYFEELTNEIEINKFQDVLENIIFEYIPDNEKLGKPNFKELENYKTGNVNTAIQRLIIDIQNINKKIIALEAKKHPDYIGKIKGKIFQKEIEINAQKKILEELPTITNPNDGARDFEQQTIIADDNKKLDALNATLKREEKKKLELTSKIVAVQQLKEKIEQQKQCLDEFIRETNQQAEEYDLSITEILKIETNYFSIDELILNTQNKLSEIEIYFESYESIQKRNVESNNESLCYKIKILTDEVHAKTEKLSSQEKAFQKNEEQKRSINEKIKSLTGDPETPSLDTLSFYKNEEKFIAEDLSAILKEERDERIKKSLKIFEKKKEIIELFNSFKTSVDNTIRGNKDLLENYDIKIDSSFNLNTIFYRKFLGFINQKMIGHFRGVDDGESRIKSIVEDNGFSDEGKIEALLTNIIAKLECENNKISNQINSEKLNDFYNYTFSLDYINPKYELKLGGKMLAQLSPGERGALLLIFYLMIDKEEIPLVIDQPEDNLDNESVYNMLSKFIKQSKKKRQIIMVTHNPNLAVGADAEQIIYVNIDKQNQNEFSFFSGSIENPKINQKIVQILEGTKPAFDKRKLRYEGK